MVLCESEIVTQVFLNVAEAKSTSVEGKVWTKRL